MLQVEITERKPDGQEIKRYTTKKYRTMRGIERLYKSYQNYYSDPRYTVAIVGEPEPRRRQDNSAAIGQAHVGDIFHCMWGYDMIINDFYEVVSVSKTGKSVITRKIATHVDGDPYSPAGGAQARPMLTGDRFIGKPERHTLQAYGKSIYIRINSFSTATLMEPEDYLQDYTEDHLD